jgi:hypothetical protein
MKPCPSSGRALSAVGMRIADALASLAPRPGGSISKCAPLSILSKISQAPVSRTGSGSVVLAWHSRWRSWHNPMTSRAALLLRDPLGPAGRAQVRPTCAGSSSVPRPRLAWPQQETPPPRGRRAFLREATIPATRAFGESTCPLDRCRCWWENSNVSDVTGAVGLVNEWPGGTCGPVVRGAHGVC